MLLGISRNGQSMELIETKTKSAWSAKQDNLEDQFRAIAKQNILGGPC